MSESSVENVVSVRLKRRISPVRARKLRRRGVFCWWSIERGGYVRYAP